MNYTHGYFARTNEVWRNPRTEKSGPNVGTTIPEQWMVDPYLPVLENDPDDPRRGIVIPGGRFCSVGTAVPISSTQRRTLANTGKMPLTTHDGKNLAPVGMSTSQIYRQFNDGMADSYAPTVRKGFLAEVIHTVAVNDAHGALSTGDRVTGYYGSTASTTVINYGYRGRPVKWISKKMYIENNSAGASHPLDPTVYPGITPRVVAAMANDGSFIGATSALTYNGSSWTAGFTGTGSGTVENVWFEYGQDEDQIAGEITSLRSITDINADDSMFKYVEHGPWFDVPIALQKKAVSNVVLTDPDSDGETPATVTAGRVYRVANYPMDLHSPVSIYVKGTVVDMEGNSTVYTSTWFQLPNGAVRDSRNTFYGEYHTVNWATGLIEIAANITVTAIKVGYSYITDNRDGIVQYGQGLHNLTDGRNLEAGATYNGTTVVPTNPAGTPAHLNLADVVGAIGVFVN